MKMEDLKNKRIKVGITSITCKDDHDKTSGLVRNVCKFQQLQPSKLQTFYKAVRASGIWTNGLVNNVICDGEQLYYLHDLRPLDNYNYLYADHPEKWESETNHYNLLVSIAENAPKYNIIVIPCYVL